MLSVCDLSKPLFEYFVTLYHDIKAFACEYRIVDIQRSLLTGFVPEVSHDLVLCFSEKRVKEIMPLERLRA